MCGIAGIVSQDASQIHIGRLKAMNDAIAHRGPDGEGFWINPSNTVGFAHRRLSVIDLSAAAAQPMHLATTDPLPRYTIVYNGEIYNYLEIRDELFSKGYIFQSRCDTEVILAAYDHYKEECLRHFDGMFAFALWDEAEQTLFIARDRLGEKPFYYTMGNAGDTFLFASEMKALWAAGIEKKADRQSLLYYLGAGLTQFPMEKSRTFYANIQSLPPAHYIKWQIAAQQFAVKRYWDIHPKHDFISRERATEQFRSLFFTSVKRRLRSDVRTGTSLSGGLDSSAIVGVINNLITTENYKSFSAIFPGFEKDESRYIEAIAATFGLDDYTTTPSAETMVNLFEKLCYHQEQPFGSAGIYTQYEVCKLARKHGTKVLLDGQGADEILGGYSRHIHWYLQELLVKRKFNLFSREKNALQENNIAFQWGYRNYLAAFAPASTATALKRKEEKNIFTNTELTREFISAYFEKNKIYKRSVSSINDILYYDVMETGLEELLRYADRNAMAHGIEMRLPYLNHELVEFVFSLPAAYKIHQGFTKWILRESVKYIIPPAIAWRKDKVGYEPPQAQWMKHASFESLVINARKKLAASGILRKEIADIPVRPSAAYARDNYDWRYLVAAAFI
jgi:asparagine synthase (glutamine-hydrolysing)